MVNYKRRCEIQHKGLRLIRCQTKVDANSLEEFVPVRKIPKNHRSLTGFVNGEKNGRPVGFESSLERDLFTLLEFDPLVECFEEQPATIDFVDAEGRSRSYTPDVLIRYRCDFPEYRGLKTELCEVKYRKDLFENWSEIKPKIKAGRAYAKERGWEFRILTEREIRTDYLVNAKFLLGYRNLGESEGEEKELIDMLREMRVTEPQCLIAACRMDRDERAQLIPWMWKLVCEGRIGCDLRFPLTMITPIWYMEYQ